MDATKVTLDDNGAPVSRHALEGFPSRRNATSSDVAVFLTRLDLLIKEGVIVEGAEGELTVKSDAAEAFLAGVHITATEVK